MAPFRGNLPDEIWGRLKQWAKLQAGDKLSPTSDACIEQVLRITAEITGQANSLRPEVVAFYANETAEMIAKFCEQHSPSPVDPTGEVAI